MANQANEEARNRYGKLFDDVAALLFRHDPMHINFDSNTDEYYPEARTILPRLPDCQTEWHVFEVVIEEFRRWFGEVHDDDEVYKLIAAEIWQVWLASQRAE